MINIESYMIRLKESLLRRFGKRLVYMGLQGSYLRGEATENSDVDVMTVIDGLTVADMDAYRAIIKSMECPEKSCGFICSKKDLANWNPMEICGLVAGTKDYHGELRALVPAFSRDDVVNFTKMSLNNLYHEICHRYIHSGRQRSAEALPGTYKGVFFILQNLHYLKTGEFISGKACLLEKLEGMDRQVLQRALDMNNCADYDFAESFGLLFTWCQETLAAL